MCTWDEGPTEKAVTATGRWRSGGLSRAGWTAVTLPNLWTAPRLIAGTGSLPAQHAYEFRRGKRRVQGLRTLICADSR